MLKRLENKLRMFKAVGQVLVNWKTAWQTKGIT